MDPVLAERILLDRKVAYALTDRQLQVTETGGDVAVLRGNSDPWLGRPLVDLVPELVGSESALADILAGALPRLEMAWINRETPDGRTRYLTMVELPYHNAEGQIVGLLHLAEDGTESGSLKQHLSQSRNELRLAQERLTNQNLALATANAELRRLDDLKSTFVSVAAHELRTPLTAIQGYLEMLLDEDAGPLSVGQREYLRIIQSSTRSLLDITSSLLDVTRIEAGRLDLVLQPTDLPALVHRVAAEYEPQVEARAQDLTIHHRPALPPALVDPTRTSQIVGNLLSNAIKYSPRNGQIRITVAPAQEEGFLQLSVADNGVGIGPEDQDKLFRRFFRAASATQMRAGGVGLGLYITRSLVELHGGRVWFESKLHEGSTFHVTLPIAD
jgi:signal transduction histidine kinase